MSASKLPPLPPCVVWDWNGTLFDDAWLCVEIMDGMLRQRGLPGLSAEQYAEWFDFPVRRYYERLGFDLEREPFDRIGAEFIRLYETRRYECALRAGARELLEGLRRRGVNQVLISAYHRDSLLSLLDHFEIRDLFSTVLGASDVYAYGKIPLALEWFQNHGRRPSEIWVIGDTLHDAEMARHLGALCWLVFAGHQSRRRLETAGAPVVEGLEQLPLWTWAVENLRA